MASRSFIVVFPPHCDTKSNEESEIAMWEVWRLSACPGREVCATASAARMSPFSREILASLAGLGRGEIEKRSELRYTARDDGSQPRAIVGTSVGAKLRGFPDQITGMRLPSVRADSMATRLFTRKSMSCGSWSAVGTNRNSEVPIFTAG